MHLVLTDRLTCPRCGPAFGLILLAESLRDRRVLEGSLGCANCRDRYPIRGGFGDLRPPPRGALPDVEPPEPRGDDEGISQLRSLLGAVGGSGHTLAVGRAAAWAPALAGGMEGDAEMVVVDSATRSWPEDAGVSRLATTATLPFFDRSLRGVLLHGEDLHARVPGDASGHALLTEAARVLAAGSRVVVLEPPSGIDAALRKAGLPEALASSTLAAAGR